MCQSGNLPCLQNKSRRFDSERGLCNQQSKGMKMAKTYSHELSCKIKYGVRYSEWSSYCLAQYIYKEFVDDIEDVSFSYLGDCHTTIEVKFSSLKQAAKMDGKIKKYIRDFRVSKIKETKMSDFNIDNVLM